MNRPDAARVVYSPFAVRRMMIYRQRTTALVAEGKLTKGEAEILIASESKRIVDRLRCD